MAMEKASESTGEAGSGLGMGLGMMMPAMFAESFRPQPGAGGGAGPVSQGFNCPDCGNSIPQGKAYDIGAHEIILENTSSVERKQFFGHNLDIRGTFQ